MMPEVKKEIPLSLGLLAWKQAEGKIINENWSLRDQFSHKGSNWNLRESLNRNWYIVPSSSRAWKLVKEELSCRWQERFDLSKKEADALVWAPGVLKWKQEQLLLLVGIMKDPDVDLFNEIDQMKKYGWGQHWLHPYPKLRAWVEKEYTGPLHGPRAEQLIETLKFVNRRLANFDRWLQ